MLRVRPGVYTDFFGLMTGTLSRMVRLSKIVIPTFKIRTLYCISVEATVLLRPLEPHRLPIEMAYDENRSSLNTQID